MQTLQMCLFTSAGYSVLKWVYNKYISEVKQKQRQRLKLNKVIPVYLENGKQELLQVDIYRKYFIGIFI